MRLKCLNNAQCFCLTKILEKNASIMYKKPIRSTWFSSGSCINNQYDCTIRLTAEKSPLWPKHVLFVLILKRKNGNQSFLSIGVSLRRKHFVNTLWRPHFSIWRLKKTKSVTSKRLPKKVNFGPCNHQDTTPHFLLNKETVGLNRRDNNPIHATTLRHTYVPSCSCSIPLSVCELTENSY